MFPSNYNDHMIFLCIKNIKEGRKQRTIEVTQSYLNVSRQAVYIQQTLICIQVTIVAVENQ